MDDKKQTVQEAPLDNPLNGILLNKALKVSDDPHPIHAVIQKNEECIEVMNGLTEQSSVTSSPAVGGAVVFWMFLSAIPIGIPALVLVSILIILTAFVVLPLIFGRNLESNFRLNVKTNKLYGVDKKTAELISCDLDKITVHKFQNFRMSARGTSRDFNLAFSGRDETTGDAFSFPTPILSNEDHCIDNWEYFRRFMSGEVIPEVKVEEGVSAEHWLLGKTFRGQMKKRLNFGLLNFGLRPMKRSFLGVFEGIKSFNVLGLLVNILFLFLSFLGTIWSVFMLPGDLIETWAYFYWKKKPKFSKENNELCGFSKKADSQQTA